MFKTLLTAAFKNMFFVMSISGTVVFILYLLLYPLSKRYFSLKWRYRILKLAMMFFLAPFPLCKYYVWGFFYDHFPLIREIASRYESSEMNVDYTIVANRDSISLSPKVQSIYLAVSVIVLISSFLLWKQIMKYRKMKRVCFSDLKESTEPKLQELFFKRKSMLNVKRKVNLICSEYCKSPITVGVLSPTILFPIWDKDNMPDDKQYEYMITHELVHIKHNDVLIKLTALLVMAIHWFNPFAYLLVGELSCISEMYCDSVVMEGKGEKERRKYGNLLLKLIEENMSLDKEQFGVGFADFRKKNMYKRRILEMKRSKKYKSSLSVIMAAFICIAGGITVFAYSPPDTITNENEKPISANLIVDESFLPPKLLSDCFAVADDGTVYDFCHINENDRKICEHNHSIPIEVTLHKKEDNGSCTVTTYSALKCLKCSDRKNDKLLSTAICTPCPH